MKFPALGGHCYFDRKNILRSWPHNFVKEQWFAIEILLDSLRAFGMLPQTRHVENVVHRSG